MEWKLWFIQLSGWPVFLTIAALVFTFMLGLSVVLTRISSRSVGQNAVLAVISVALLSIGMLGLAALLTRL
jgi:energy-coupling factor transporter transmembrane protein EcfT